jgi:hypothetical protein
MIRTPSCFSNSSKAIFPGIIGMDRFPTGGHGGRRMVLIRYKV